jgi:hypothetical protein
MGLIKSRLFVQVQCVSIDCLLRVLVSAGDWLSACVAVERAISVSKGVKFNKRKSKQYKKWIILLSTICMHLHDSIHRASGLISNIRLNVLVQQLRKNNPTRNFYVSNLNITKIS